MVLLILHFYACVCKPGSGTVRLYCLAEPVITDCRGYKQDDNHNQCGKSRHYNSYHFRASQEVRPNSRDKPSEGLQRHIQVDNAGYPAAQVVRYRKLEQGLVGSEEDNLEKA